MKINYADIFLLFMTGVMISMLITILLTAGCLTAAKNTAISLIPTPTPPPPPTPTPTPTPTPKQTPVGLPTIAQTPVDPFLHGERWEGQWFKWHRPALAGNLTLDAGIIVYRHAWLSNYTWYNQVTGNYQRQEPTKGNRYFAVWVHQEVFGTDGHNNTGMGTFYDDSYRLQIKNTLIEVDKTHNPVCRILDFDTKYDYYNTVIAPPFGWSILYVGKMRTDGGYLAVRVGGINPGKYNGVDGYLLFEVPEKTMNEDVILLGNYARFGSAYWRFDD